MTEQPTDEEMLERMRNATVPALDHHIALLEIKRLRAILRNASIMAFTLCGVLVAALLAAYWWPR